MNKRILDVKQRITSLQSTTPEKTGNKENPERLLWDIGLYPVTCILNKHRLASSQAGSIGRATRQEAEAGQ